MPSIQVELVRGMDGRFADLDKIDDERFPNCRRAKVIDVIQEPNESLVVPVGWSVDVRALEVSVTLSFTNFALPNTFV